MSNWIDFTATEDLDAFSLSGWGTVISEHESRGIYWARLEIVTVAGLVGSIDLTGEEARRLVKNLPRRGADKPEQLEE